MRLLVILLGVSILFFCQAEVSAFEWQNLHELAVGKTVKSADDDFNRNQSSPEKIYILGLCYLADHRDQRAMDTFEIILRIDPDIYQARWGMAEVLRRKHKLSDSEKILNKIISNHPDFSPARISLAYIKYTQFKYEESAGLAFKVIAQGKDKVDKSNFARAYLIAAGSKGTIAHFGGPISKLINGTRVKGLINKAHELESNAAETSFGLGAYYMLAPKLAGGDLEMAQKYLEETISRDPLFVDAYVRLAQLYMIKKDINKYNQYLDKALEIDPGNELALDAKSGRCKYICP